ncbi:baculoviral IAP repeat-containing protein 7-like [Saccostrea echinata]|uniref:baculoviral IAP repeat-containing protein 7-like n=1 Tax=Saccostrea echinata TaxID=191078 RepID=UPI002A7EE420|nr:baculoviral IAP repeat-containing protein 7-like [Saccostrea echinata]
MAEKEDNTDCKNGQEKVISRKRVLSDSENTVSESVGNLSQHDASSVDGNLLKGEAAQTILMMGYLPGIIHQAMNRILERQSCEISPQSILDEIEKLKQDGNAPDIKVKKPKNTDNMKNQAVPQDMEELRRQNLQMHQMLLCKACKMVDISHVLLSCGHLICEACLQKLEECWYCKSAIRGVQKVRFASDRD